MLLIWVGNQALTVYLSFLIVLPLIYTSTLSGFESVDKEMLARTVVVIVLSFAFEKLFLPLLHFLNRPFG